MERAVHPVLVAQDNRGLSTPAKAVTNHSKWGLAPIGPLWGRKRETTDRRVLVWMVASAAGVQAFFQAGDAYLSASVARTLLWLIAMAVTFALAAVIERYKDSRGG